MKLSCALCHAALAILFLLPQSCGQEPATKPQLPEQPVHTHPIFEHWQQVLMEQSEPELLLGCSVREGEQLPEEERKEFEEARANITTALEAAKKLYQARIDLIYNIMNIPGCRYFEEMSLAEEAKSYYKPWSEDGKAVFEFCRQWIAEGFRRDLASLGACGLWLDVNQVDPALRPGRQECLLRPELNSLIFEQVHAERYGIGAIYSDINTLWMERQDHFMKRFLDCYNDENLLSPNTRFQDPFTYMCWVPEKDGSVPPGIRQFQAYVQECMRREQEAWEHYLEAMREIVCPCRGYRGSGHGSFMREYTSHLLDSRERFLCLLTIGSEQLHKLPDLPADRYAALQELHADHRFGEIFTCEAHIFRHPKLEGNPWCIRFRRQGAGFIFVNDGPALRHFLSLYPEGGDIEVRGYQAVEMAGTAYKQTKESDYTNIGWPQPRPAGGLEPRQVFHLLACTDLNEEEQQEEEEGE